MKPIAAAVLVALSAAAVHAADARCRDAAGPPPEPAGLAGWLPPAPPGWEATHEAVDVERDPALRGLGLRASVARHYGRAEGAVSWLCTVELWSFATAAEACAAIGALGRPNWWMRSEGALLVLAHGVRMERRVGSRRSLVPGCRALAEAVAAP